MACGKILRLPVAHSVIHSRMVSTSLTEVELFTQIVKVLMGKPRNPCKCNTIFTCVGNFALSWVVLCVALSTLTCLPVLILHLCFHLLHVLQTHTDAHTYKITFNHLPLCCHRIGWGAKATAYHYHHKATGNIEGCLYCKSETITPH